MCFILSWEYRVVNCCFSLGGREGEGGREGHLDLSLDETPPILLWRRIDTYKA